MIDDPTVRSEVVDLLALVLVHEKQLDLALDMLEAAVDANLYFNWQIRIDSNYAFAGMHSDPRYVAVLEKVREKIRAERSIVADPQQVSARSD